MTNYEVKVYMEYIKVLLSMHHLNEDVLDRALDKAIEAFDDTDYNDFEYTCQRFCHQFPQVRINTVS